ncbi:TB2/DP1 HVA22 family protein, partial [Trifolium medium]|nr:TB2/DP1 HVA22 family protein [Trifolium medium]
MPKIGPSQTASSATVETKGRSESDTVGGEVPQSSTSTLKEVQKEWTCALCLVTTTSEKDLNSHFNGRKHMAACEAALKAKNQPAPQKLQIYLPKVEVKQKNFSDMLNSNVKNGDGIVNKGLKGT